MTGRHENPEGRGWARTLRLPFALLLVNAALVGPLWLRPAPSEPPFLAVETLLLGVLFFLPHPRGWRRSLGWAVGGVLSVVTVLLLGDAVARSSLARPLNLYLDWHLLGAVWNLVRGMLGTIVAGLTVGGLVAGAGILAVVLARLLAETPPVHSRRLRWALGGLAVLLVATVAWRQGADDARRAGAGGSAIGSPVWSLASDQVQRVGRILETREAFAAELERARSSYRNVPRLLAGLDRRSVVLAFVESYGMTTLEDARYASVIRPRLEEMEDRLAEAGLHVATGSLVAPTQGGQSWFSHGSLLAGLWLDDQLKYDLLVASDRETLVDDFRRAGYRTAVVMPAITMAWPEGEWFGYDDIWVHRNIDYRGPPLNWVTMPDQYTWSFLERVVRPDAADPARPLFVEVGLISSHAPWTPILPVLDWDSIGRGEVFAPWENAGERPEELWRDTERVRRHFALSVDYALRATTAYAERFVDPGTLLIVLGDHQPAPLITGEGASRAVPVHVISGDPTLLRPFLDWGFRSGAFPDPGRKPPRMDAFRTWFVTAFTPPAPQVPLTTP